ncbi:MAG: F0F1 ATP synthase subunit epsilon [Alphaproteobacteria bacterium]|nr:F0F1 ATP synthase subunit epsilon [Alphaproteobacteria bacterium]
MAEMLNFEMVSPERLLLSEEVTSVTVPGTDGDFTVFAAHAPVLSTMRPGVVDVQKASGEERIFVRGGFAEVNPAGLIILAEEAIAMADLNKDTLAQQIQNAQEDVDDASDDEKKRRAQEALDHLKQLETAL